jgi:hypothetical protein
MVKRHLSINFNKKGDFMLGEYTLKMVIAVLCLLLLVYLLFSFYSSFTNKQDLSKARGTLDTLSEKMSQAKSKSDGEAYVPLLNPDGWRLIGYSGTEKPQQCINNCICLCANRLGDRWVKDQIEKCEAIGVCKDFDESINEFNIKIMANIVIKYEEGAYSIKENTGNVVSDKV